MDDGISLCPGIVSENSKLQPLNSHPWSRHAAWDPFPTGTPDVLYHRTCQRCLTKSGCQNPIGRCIFCCFCFSLPFRSDQIRSVAQLCPTLCDPMNRSTPGLPVQHQLPEFTETHVRRVSDAIQPSHPLSSPSPPAPNPSQHQSLFQ